ncbi:Phosphoglycerol transferase and related proteins, alkaline phosphatase superfamily [Pragia fontium]|uniref:LTA synthase family protein n=1 Tax=Pragia fontium TaxID=82985 RepID=UPI000E065222|nr:LTA synthase family protein [Pragia fontium]SUB82050.1 Phosphoglycerol transferase and related proteins, alkaline phosphatase superfamily [Pragia fontium]
MLILFKNLINKVSSKKINSTYFDIVFFILILYSLSQSIVIAKEDLFILNNFNSAIKYLWLSSPIIFLYLLLRLIRIPILLCGYITLSIIFTLEFINNTKTALTGEPLSFNDITSGVNLTIAGRYLTMWPIAIGLIIFFGGIISIILSKKIITTRKKHFLILTTLIIITPFSFSPYFIPTPENDNKLYEKINSLANKFDVVYFSWDWPGNVRTHGLPMHLIQTSTRKSVPKATNLERELYEKERNIHSISPAKHKTIIYILCESCWYDSKNFIDKFSPLFHMGYKQLRATSSVYGGGTANSEFEMLTGLPSNSKVLSGIIYQEYAGFIKPNADTLASALKNRGFITFSAHNNDKGFWRRDVIYQKFGFDKFEGLSDMGALPPEYASKKKSWQWQPDDYLLYRAALSTIKQANGKKIFLNLITMSTHGPFQHINDYGEGVYNYQINESIERITEFSKELEKIDPDAVIVIYGDHKPSLNKFFYENNVLPSDLFLKTGDNDQDFIFKGNVTPKDFGDVPVLIKSKDEESIKRLVEEANNKPFFCLSTLIDKYFINSGLPAFNYNNQNICGKDLPYSYEEESLMTPTWFYSLALFQD